MTERFISMKALVFKKLGTFKHFMEINGQIINFDIMELLLEQK